MVVDQVGNRFAAVLLGQIVFGAMVLLDVVVFDVRLGSVVLNGRLIGYDGVVGMDVWLEATYTLVCKDSV